MRLPFQLLPVNQPDRADLAHFLHIGGVVPHPTNNVPQVSTIEDQFAVIDGVAALGTHAPFIRRQHLVPCTDDSTYLCPSACCLSFAHSVTTVAVSALLHTVPEGGRFRLLQQAVWDLTGEVRAVRYSLVSGGFGE
jgi:hypothetical protein